MAKIEIDNKKMWEAMAKFAPNKESLLWVNMCVESQGLKLNDNFEIVSIEPESQRMTSAKAKEALLPDRELTEFEDLFIHIYQQKYPCELSDKDLEFCRKAANELLSIARKQFIEEACEWLEENLINYWSQAYTDNCDFIEDFRKALEKGVVYGSKRL